MILFTGVCVCVWADTPRQTPRTDTPPGHSPSRDCGRYATYWNAFLFFVVFVLSRIKELNWSHNFCNNMNTLTSLWPSGFQSPVRNLLECILVLLLLLFFLPRIKEINWSHHFCNITSVWMSGFQSHSST